MPKNAEIILIHLSTDLQSSNESKIQPIHKHTFQMTFMVGAISRYHYKFAHLSGFSANWCIIRDSKYLSLQYFMLNKQF